MNRLALISAIGGAGALFGGTVIALWPAGTPWTPIAQPAIVAGPLTPTPTAAPTKGEPPAASPGIAPSFDIVRVSPQGDAVIAGRAEPQAEVRVSDGTTLLGTAKADARGEWVLVPEKKLAPGDRQLSLTAVQPGSGAAVKGDAEVALSIPAREVPAQTPLAVLVPSRPDAPVRALQLPGGKVAGDALALEAVEYDAAGRMSLSGHGRAGSAVTLFLDEQAMATARVGPDGRWTAQPDRRVDAGRYTLRVDELGPGGRVTGRVSLPFQRAEVPGNARPGEWLVVQPGHSLWRIARQTYGSGLRYAEVYAENRGQIADPDLIFPGQALKLPAN